ncbi:uncharacterized protein EDB93DRAFT_1324867 [Suillus bovinus]|uniref:uncharacterized protein n=1 Tax=Suillus bovinus TaxID=48563 RepID=UPI001B8826FB|nr:uncharacterized protein EDB93DRAFT_1324867 [Suillus bovinus]KAG2159475.1 hypothetical protein EDB93DRAFT_1324867 [Suillus bovinus]
MSLIPLAASAPPAPGLAPLDPAEHSTEIHAAARIDAIVDRSNLCVDYLLNFQVAFEQVMPRLRRMQLGFDDAVMGFNDMEEALDWLEEMIQGMTGTLKKMSHVVVEILDSIDETFDVMVEGICALEEKVEVIEDDIDELIYGDGLWPIRICNHRCSSDDPLIWPPVSDTPYPTGKPETLAELQSMNAEMCTALAAALHLRPPPGQLQSTLEWRRNQVINHLGCAE